VPGSDTDRDEDAFVEPSTEHRAPSTLSSEHRAPSTVSLLARARAGSLLLAPLLLGEERLGVLVMVSQKADLGEEWGTFARAVGSQIGQAIGLARGVSDLKQNRDQLRQLAARLQAIREEERARAAREVHDELGQLLTCLKMDVAWLRNRLPPGEEDLHAKAASMSEMLDETFGAVRRIATALRPQILDSLGLEAAIEWQAEEFQSRTSIVCAVSGLPLGVDLDGARSTALFRIFQETLTNVARHAGATHVAARLATEDGDLVLEVADNGRGISAGDAAGRGSLGLLGMRERALLIGGDIRVVGAAGRGTTVTVRVPMGQRA
jgi:signal transduction histidine kinase